MNKVVAFVTAGIIILVGLTAWIVISVNAPNEDLDRFNERRLCVNSIDKSLPSPLFDEEVEARCGHLLD